MTPAKGDWLFALLWINLAVALVILILVASNQISSVHQFFHLLIYCLFYSNLTGILGMLVMRYIALRAVNRKLPLIPVVSIGVILFTIVGCLLAQTILMLVGFVVPRNFWAEYFYTVRVAVPLGVVFGAGALTHALLRERVKLTEEKLHAQEAAEERARKLAAEARLHSLESRIHPHFLFNTLNSITSLIPGNPAKAEETVGRLAGLLRSSLDNSNKSLVPLHQELAITEDYVEIEKVRFGGKLRGHIEVAEDLRDIKVPPLSIQSLVENSVKHGITPQRGGGEFAIKAALEDQSLCVEVCDTGPGFDLTAVPAGRGLDNLVERLNALYGDAAKLNVFRRDGWCVVRMTLPRS